MSSSPPEVEVVVHFPARQMDELADALVTLTEHICNKDPDREVGGFLGGRFGYGAEWDSAVFEMFPDGDYDCDCGQDAAFGEEFDRRFSKEVQKRDGFWLRADVKALEEKYACKPTCIKVRPNFRHKPSGLTVRWYKYIGRDMEVEGSGDVAAILAECIADVAAPPFEPYVYKPPTEAEMAEMDKIFNKMVEDGAIQFVEFGGDDEESDDDIPF
jgi:hypothetical protein